MAVLKTDCPDEMKRKVTEFRKKLGETESAIIRKAVLNYMKAEGEPKEYKPIKDYGGRP